MLNYYAILFFQIFTPENINTILDLCGFFQDVYINWCSWTVGDLREWWITNVSSWYVPGEVYLLNFLRWVSRRIRSC